MSLVLVGVGGPSSSGKTTVAKALHLLCPKSTLVHLDDFYYSDEFIPRDPEKNVQNWDCAGAIDWEKFKEYIAEVRKTNGAILPIESLELPSELKLSPEEREQLVHLTHIAENTHLVFVDGFMLYHDDSILELFDIKLFFHAPYKVLKDRRAARQGYNTVAGFWVDPPNYFDEFVWPEFAKSHKHLFENGDVEGKLNSMAQKAGIADAANDGTKDLPELVTWALKEIGWNLEH